MGHFLNRQGRLWLVVAVGLSLPRAHAAVDAMVPTEVSIDTVLVLDNSGSMKTNDPRFLAKQGLELLVEELPSDTRLALVVFDDTARLALPLTPLSEQTRDAVIRSLDRVDYRGRFSDSPAAMERALYELKLNGRPGAKKSIVFITDGIIDTGNSLNDLDRARWVREELAEDAARNGVRVFAIATGDKADLQLLHTLAQKSGGKYYRTDRPEDLAPVFTRIGQSLTAPWVTTGPSSAAPPAPLSPPRSEARSTPGKPDAVAAEAQPSAAEDPSAPETRPTLIEDSTNLWLIGLAGVVLVILFGSRIAKRRIIFKGPAKEAPAPSTERPMPLAFLVRDDTGHTHYPLTSRPTLVGRSAPNPTEDADHVPIDRSDISCRHAVIEYKQLAYWLIDQKSTHGTFVNGQRVTQEVRLKHGDRLRFHDIEFEFVWSGMEAAKTTALTIFEDGYAPVVTRKPISAGSAAEESGRSPAIPLGIGDDTLADLKDAMSTEIASRKPAVRPIAPRAGDEAADEKSSDELLGLELHGTVSESEVTRPTSATAPVIPPGSTQVPYLDENITLPSIRERERSLEEFFKN